MRKLLPIFLLFPLAFVLSCNSAINTDRDESTVDKVEVQKKFIGQWKYYSSYPVDPKDDGSMNGIICNLEKYENTDETLVFHLWTGNDLILSIQDADTLSGQNVKKLKVRYVEDTGHLILVENEDGSGLEFSRLK